MNKEKCDHPISEVWQRLEDDENNPGSVFKYYLCENCEEIVTPTSFITAE